jgi:glutaredoxin
VVISKVRLGDGSCLDSRGKTKAPFLKHSARSAEYLSTGEGGKQPSALHSYVFEIVESTRSIFQGGMPHPRTRLSATVEALNSISENYGAVVPLLTIVLAIGLMKFLPEKTTVPLFSDDKTAQQFFEKNQISLPSKMPILLVTTPCDSCKALKAQLSAAGIQYVEQDVVANASAVPLFQAAKTASGNPDLPKVIIDNKIIPPTISTIRSELGG